MDKALLQQELEKAAEGLLFMSETDAPLQFYYHETATAEPVDEELIATLAGKTAGKEVVTEDLTHFFRNMTNPHPDAGEEMLANAGKFQKLVATLQEHLTEVTVYKIQEQATKVLILGKTASGAIAGYETLVVET
ncbi:sugar-non-specific nuclease inhibitor NuiA-like protein [Pontibacter qinzhouensis]|uniref:Sugar-non-specific nuclease inhibitor NuiA-like protein n=1 Tax=Pontibacter qinzhouensis TaxID=2603253 RepID=A0A5C8J2X3_9BACT|nr:nuclease A inhibitor family protein [Pontibacter qinzhouensis]TXK29678.1 sugar-non-specific nuclease inhibitor NuiA-like protein [Pontibacter qinzhouensis]